MKYFLLFILVLVTTIGRAQNGSGDATSPDFKDSIDQYVRKLMTEYHIIGASVSVINKEQALFEQHYGYSDLKTETPVDERIRFRVGSISKTFTAFSVMQLVEQGKIDLNMPVEHYIPKLHLQYQPGIRAITVKDLLTHTSGLTDDIINTPNGYTQARQGDLINLLNQEILTISPGLKKLYSNIGFGLLGCLVEEVSGIPYPDYVKQNIFIPLGMNNSAVSMEMGPAPGRIKGYLKDSTEIEEPPIRDMAAGGIESSMSDMIKFGRMIMNQGQGPAGLIVRKETFQDMVRNHLDDIKLKTDEVFGYGLFIHRMGTDQDAIIGNGVGHAGDLRLHHSLLFIYPQLDMGMIILTNSERGSAMRAKLSQKIMATYMRTYKNVTLSRSVPSQFSIQSLSADHIDHTLLAGTYGGGGEDFIRLKKIGNKKLRFTQRGDAALILKRSKNNLYTTKYLLLKCIPIPVKNMMFGFKQEGDAIFMKVLDNKHKTAEYLSIKDPQIPLGAAWRNRAGEYEAVNVGPNFMMMKPYALKCIQNKIVLYRKDSISDLTDEIGFNPLNDISAISDGFDRGSGATLKVLPNGNIYYSGFELKKKGENTVAASKK